jgi:hypothetical protein
MDQLLIKRKNRIRINICQDLGRNVKVTYLVRLEIGAQRWVQDAVDYNKNLM